MNYIKINQEAIKQMIKGTKWGHNIPGYWDGEYLVITFDGYCAYILPRECVRFDTSVIKSGSDNGFLPGVNDFIVPSNEIRKTKTLFESGFRSNALLRLFKGAAGEKKWNVYIDENMIKPLKDEGSVIFYQVYKEKKDMTKEPILAATPSGRPLMIFMPIRIVDETEFEC